MNRIFLVKEWQYLVRSFTEDVLVRDNARVAMLSVLKYEDTVVGLHAETQSHFPQEFLQGQSAKN